MSDLPLVSIITPTYNRVDLLPETIASVLDQGYPRLEYLVLDDGSTDATVDLLRSHGDDLRRCTHANMGETRTVNKGFSMVGGDIIAVVNSDDPLRPGAVETLVERLVARPDLVAAYPGWDEIDGAGAVVGEKRRPPYDYLLMVRRHDYLPGPAAFMRSEAVRRVGGRDPEFTYVGDFDFWLRLGLLGPLEHVPRPLATFRVHEHGASLAARGAAMAREHVEVMRRYFATEGLPPEVRALRREAMSRAHVVAALSSGPASFRKIRHLLACAWYHPAGATESWRRAVDQRAPGESALVGGLREVARRLWPR